MTLTDLLKKSFPYIVTILITGVLMFFIFKGCEKPEVITTFPQKDSLIYARIDSVKFEINKTNQSIEQILTRLNENKTQEVINNYYYAVEKEKIKQMSKDSLYKWLLKEANK